MAIKFKTVDEPLTVKPPVTVVYGAPGVGKTTFALTSENPLLLDFDRRAAQAGIRAPKTVEVESWREIAQLATDNVLSDVSTIVIDTVGRALDVLSRQLIADERRLGRRNGGLTLEGYGTLKATWSTWIRSLQASGKGIVMVCHSTEQRDATGDGMVERLDIVGSSRDYTYQISDVMGRLVIREDKRIWITRPSAAAFGKDPMGDAQGDRIVPPITESTTTLADYLREIVEFVVRRTGGVSLDTVSVDLMRSSAEACNNPLELTRLAIESKDQPKHVLAQITAVATERGWIWESKSQQFKVKRTDKKA